MLLYLWSLLAPVVLPDRLVRFYFLRLLYLTVRQDLEITSLYNATEATRYLYAKDYFNFLIVKTQPRGSLSCITSYPSM